MCIVTVIAVLLALATGRHVDAQDEKSTKPMEQRPNIVLIFADDQRADTIAALGNPAIRTPNLDRLVQRGLSFDRAYMQGGMHGATRH